MNQLGKYSLRRQHLGEELRQEIDLTDQNEIANRRSVRDGDHCGEASRIAAISRSRSSIV